MTNETNGILIVDKPRDITSARVISRIKKISGIQKIGHTGTLDPMATGVIICTINRATRLSRFFLASPKKYAAVLKLGVETDTLDATGSILATRQIGTVSEHAVCEACKQFEGEIYQIPPAYSALKHNGVPLYKYARNGTPVTKPPRKVFISYIKIIDINLPEIRFETECSSGTYIRTLCADIGNMLGCGGHLKALKRIGCGGFDILDAIPLADIESHQTLETIKNRLIPMSDALSEMMPYVADNGLMEKIKYGKSIALTDIKIDIQIDTRDTGSPFIKIIDDENQLLAVLSPDESNDRYNYCCVFHNP
ncbi:MAG: tRNA pseudouridine(55) synthase TruB [Desulfobacteraceae bacterium]|nr:tRNA pseudouridine(55) synthase TruB [Desulfobacteraceae bacterium]MBC2754446.1 tRNA pseudouridine(55) synthase TruB [Desulfobacteraceae bacterium]